MSETRRGSLKQGVINLALMVPTLPLVRFPSGREVQLIAFTAEGYELWREIQGMVQEEQDGGQVDTALFTELVDTLLSRVLPEATSDELASIGGRLEAKMAPILAAAGQVDSVMQALEALDQAGKATTDQSTPLSGPSIQSAQRSRGTARGSTKTGKGRI